MTNLSIRGLDDKALAELRARAIQEDASVNSLVLRFIEQGLGHRKSKPDQRRHNDLDAFAGAWNDEQAASFDQATAAFAAIDPPLWD